MNFEIAPKETEIQDTWDNAIIYCQFLEVDAKTGWRLPTLEELTDIYHSENDFVGSYYWSSTEYDNDRYAWVSGFSDWRQHTRKNGRFYVRAVRDIK